MLKANNKSVVRRAFWVLSTVFVSMLFALTTPMHADAHLVEQEGSIQPASNSPAPLATDEQEEPVQPVANPKSIFSVQMYGATGKNSRYFKAMDESGASWVRNRFSWMHVEPEDVTPDNGKSYNWSSPDSVVAAAIDSNINIILTIEQSPKWAATHPDGPIDRVPLSKFAEFVYDLVERYDGDGINDAPGAPIVEYFEFNNEPDRHCAGRPGWGAHGTEYGEMLKAVYPSIKAANPNAKVVFGGIAYDWFNSKTCDVPAQESNPKYSGYLSEWPIRGGGFVYEFLDEVLEACGNEPCFDVMNIHVYSAFAENWRRFPGVNGMSIGLYEKVEYVREKLQDHGHGGKPIIITEAGTPSAGPPGDVSAKDQHMQAQHVVVYYTQGMAAGVESLAWWVLYDLSPSDWPAPVGLVTQDGTPKLSYKAYQLMSEKFRTMRFEHRLSPAETGIAWESFPTMEAYKFTDPASGKILYVAWLNPKWEFIDPSWGDPEKHKLLSVWGKRATVQDIYGKTKAVITDGQDGTVDGKVTIPINGEPIYIQIDPADVVPIKSIYLPSVKKVN